MILGLLNGRNIRFGELKRSAPGISQKMLTQTLRHLERDGLLTRTVHSNLPLQIEYALTLLGKELAEVLQPLIEWTYKNHQIVEAAQAQYDNNFKSLPSKI
jgi:DNA-binding HxlR family transcriptional regulator